MAMGIKTVISGLALLLGFSVNAFAVLPQTLGEDFHEITGVVIMPVADGEYLVDLDATAGLATGDLLTIIDPGEKIIHPVTHEVMGSLDQTRAVLRVTQIKNGYSYARTVGEAKEVKRGDKVKRFSGLEARFYDYRGTGEQLYDEVQQALPQLSWLGYEKAQAGKNISESTTASGHPMLLFILGQDGLVVRDSSNGVLHSYPLPGGEPLALPSADSVSEQGQGVVIAPVVGAGKVAKEQSPIVYQEQEPPGAIWSGPLQEGTPVGLVVADLDGDGLVEVAAAYEDRIEIGRRTRSGYASIATVKTGSRRQLIRLASADLNGNGREELYASGVTNGRLSSVVIEFNGSVYDEIQKDLPFYFGSTIFPDEGKVILGQRMGDLRTDFQPPVFRVRRSGNEVSEGASVPIPDSGDIYGFLPFKSGDELLWAIVEDDHRLTVYGQNNTLLWEGGKDYANGETGIERDDPSSPSGSKGDKRTLYLKVGMERGPKGEVLIARNKGFSLMSRWRMYHESSIQALVWSGGGLREAWHTKQQEGYLAAFQVADVDNDGQKEIAMIVANPQTNPFAKRKASLVVYELQ